MKTGLTVSILSTIGYFGYRTPWFDWAIGDCFLKFACSSFKSELILIAFNSALSILLGEKLVRSLYLLLKKNNLGLINHNTC